MVVATMSSLWQISELDMAIRIFISAGLGGIIGLEREWNNHSAGLRTHILVCIGSTVIMLLSMYGFNAYVDEQSVRMDPARLAAQVVSGIGFLGAGAILRNGSSVSGLTTAASIWVVAAIGLCVGAGFLFVANLSTVIVLVSLFLLNKLEKQLMQRSRRHEVMIRFTEESNTQDLIYTLLREQGIRIIDVRMNCRKINDVGKQGIIIKEMKLSVQVKKHIDIIEAMNHIMKLENVLSTKTGALKASLEKHEEAERTTMVL